ncbi:carboxypeptidase-like regulatory domain-containing protein [Pontimicrobium aquaticum]|uniref:TonB-dependent receptor n=1 Tax=Pontimicrobium aquaticum TaxID=2565367 RepID=A0A4U0ESZ6_9FLAO|nr:carboxypeptidase-like regulatory domain-containing protein [Pontimicrobium aquaticum]TJY33462.1 TonB-dependent receptor [Pontimicrobium aquaticum]
MKKLLLSMLFCLCIVNAKAQSDTISITYSNEAIEEVFRRIENLTPYKFYFHQKWTEDKKISGSFTNKPIDFIVEEILKTTNSNYYITKDKKIILTGNLIVYNALPEGFNDKKSSDNKTKNTDDISDVPVFFNEKKSNNSTQIETVRVGKASKTSNRKVFNLSGKVIDFATGNTLSNVSLRVVNTNEGVTTNNNGFYSLELPLGEHIIDITSLGFQKITKRVIIYNDGSLDFELFEDLEELDEVLIEADIDENTRETITGLTKLDVKNIKTIPLVLGERDVLKVATTLPGISKAGEGSSGYNVRGGKEDQNLILLDGGVIYNPSHFFGLFSALNPFSIGEVNIYKGNIPAEFGGRLSSVFDLKTKKANKTKVTGEASVGPVTSNISLELPVVKEKSSLLVGGRGAYSNWILKLLDDKDISKSSASFYDFIAKYDHEINQNNNLSVTGYYSKDNFSISSDSLFSYENRLVSLKWDTKINKKNTGSVQLTNSNYAFNILYDGEAINDFDLGYNLNETELKLKVKYLHNKDLSFDYGLAGKIYNINPGEKKPAGSSSIVSPIVLPKEKALESAAFISAKYNVTEDFAINAGLRYVNYSFLGDIAQRTYLQGEPKSAATVKDTLYFGNNETVKTYGGPEARISGRYFITPDVSVKASYSNMYQFIHTLSNNTTASPIDTWKLSDLNIEPQKSQQYSLGLFTNFSDNLYEVSLEGYYKTTNNVLDYKVGAELLLNTTLETEVLQGKGKSYGLEFLLKKSKGNLNGWIGYTYSKSSIKLDSPFPEEVVNKGQYFPANFDKPHDFSLVSNYKITKRFSASMNFVYQTGRPVTYPVGSYYQNGQEIVVYSDRNKFRIPDYYRLDLSFNVEGNHKVNKLAHSFWNVSVYNVLGRNNPYSVFFVSEGGEIKAKQASVFSIPIPTITYNLKF